MHNRLALGYRTRYTNDAGIFREICTLSTAGNPEVHFERYSGAALPAEEEHSRILASSALFGLRPRGQHYRHVHPSDPENFSSWS